MNNIQIKWVRRLAWALFVAYITALVYFLFFSERYGRTSATKEYRYNLELFAEIIRFFRYRSILGIESFVVNIVGNIMAFVPFGFVLPMLHPKNKSFWYVTLTGLEFSLLVELVQLISKVGIFDVDDIFLNTIGVIFGYFVFAIIFFIYKKIIGEKY